MARATKLAEHADARLAGRYAFVRELGHGASGRVLRVADRAEGSAPRALKVVAAAHAERLKWELDVLTRVVHPGLARVFELLRIDAPVGEPFRLEAGAVVLVEEVAEGVAAMEARAVHLGEPRALARWVVKVGEQLARALAALHAAGLVHGDVKPDNVVVDADGNAKLVDLGLARPMLGGGEQGGTPAFLAPEAWRGERSARTDLFALGVTLQQLLSERAMDPEAPLPASVPPALAQLIAQLRAEDPSERPASARDAAARLAALSPGHGRVGAGADDAVTAEEAAAQVEALPLAGRQAEVARLEAELARSDVVCVAGPRGAGRTRVVAEAVRGLQRVRLAGGLVSPTYVVGTEPPGHDAVLHAGSEQLTVAEARARVMEARLARQRLCVVLESERPLRGVDATVELGPLDEDALRALLKDALPGTRPSDALVRAAMEASGGLPGRLCQLLASARRAGSELRTAAQLARLGADEPERDTVPDEARTLAMAAAWCGGSVAWDVALAVDQDAARAARALVGRGLASIDTRGRLALRPGVARGLRAHGSLPVRTALGTRLEALATEPVARAFALAARGAGGASEAFVQAASASAALGEMETAAGWLEDARALGVDSVAQAVAHGDVLRALGRYAEAEARLEGVPGAEAGVLRAELARLRGDTERARDDAAQWPDDPSADALLARVELELGQLDAADARCAALLEVRPDGRDAKRLAVAQARAGEVATLVRLARGDVRGARTAVDRLAGLAASTGAASVAARARALEGQVALAEGRAAAAAQAYAEAADQAAAAGEAHAAAAFALNAGLARQNVGDLGAALVSLRDAARRLARMGRDAELARATYALANVAHVAGDDALALVAIAPAREAAVRAGLDVLVAYCGVIEGEAALRRGALGEAGQCLEAALGALGERGSMEARATVAARRAFVAATARDAAATARWLDVARGAAEQSGAPAARLEVELADARAALARGDGPAAATAALQAHGRAESFELRLRACLLAADALELCGRRDEAQQMLTEARGLLERASQGLDSATRQALRAVPAHRRALASAPSRAARIASSDRWRKLVFAARSLAPELRARRLLERTVELAVELVSAERGFVVVRTADGSLETRAARGGSDPAAYSRSIVQRVIDEERPLSAMDAMRDAHLGGMASVHVLALRSLVAVPLRLGGGVLGALVVDDALRPAAFDDEDVALLTDLAHLAALSLETADRLRRERRAARRLSLAHARLARTVDAQGVELETLRRAGGTHADLGGIVARSEPMRRVLELVARVAQSSVPVLVTGESGTGKELVARALHDQGPRRGAPFVSENCGAIPEPLLESALFGHVRGAFTGADRARVGLFEAADGGSLFLDEIGEMSAPMQAKLLRVVQGGEVRPVGGERTRHVDVRIIAATHRDLAARVQDGSFREDLFYRLAVVVIHLPPLRDRPDDIPALVAHFAKKHARGREVRVDRRALERLAQYRWPGNVRQLENEVQRALVLGAEVLREEHLSPAVRGELDDAPAALDVHAQTDALHRRLLKEALAHEGGNQTRAAKLLGLSRFGLQKMMRRLAVR